MSAVWPHHVPGWVLRISSDRDDRRIFGGLKFSISGFFWVVKFWLVFFGVAWFKQGFFGKFNTYVSVFHVISFNAFWKFLWLGNLASCRHGIFLGFVGRPRDFFGFDFCPPSIIPVTWNSEYLLGHQVLNC